MPKEMGLQFFLGRDDVLAGHALRRQLEHRLTAGGHRPTESEQLIFRGIGPRYRFTVDRAVADRARGRKAQRPNLDRFPHQTCHRRDVVWRGRLVARAALPHRVRADRTVRHLTTNVDREFLPPDHVEVFGVAFPAPGNALGERGPGDVFDAFHQADQPVLLTRPHRGEPDTTISGDHGGDAVSAGRLQQGIPADLAVVVGVDVDEPRRDDLPGGVDGLGGIAFQR
jgi:hypothetical protein